MMDENPPEDALGVEAPTTGAIADIVQRMPREALLPGNREVIADLYVSRNVENEPKDYAFKVYVRLNAKKQTLRKVSFQHRVFDDCYFNKCHFDSCDFTDYRFVGRNFHQSSFSGCNLEYAIFERCQIDDDILECEAPRKENLKMRSARSLRMNFQQIGDASRMIQISDCCL